jgi:hypothetical protein
MQGPETGSRLVFSGSTEKESKDFVAGQLSQWREVGVGSPRFELGHNGHVWTRLAVWDAGASLLSEV